MGTTDATLTLLRSYVRMAPRCIRAPERGILSPWLNTTGSACAAPGSTISRTSTSTSPATNSSSSPVSPAPGKSSLAFDTIFAEGQRRYVESLSAYARQFLGQMEKPDVDHIDGLSPAISIDQKGTSRNPRSTVGTVTEIYDYLRLLFARIGHPHCPHCGRPIVAQSVQQMARQILSTAGRHPADDPGAGHPRPQGRAPGRPRRDPPPGLRPRARRRQRARHRRGGRARPGEVPQAHHRGRRRPPGHPARRRRHGRRTTPTASASSSRWKRRSRSPAASPRRRSSTAS